MTTIPTDAYPVIDEFGPGSTTCASGGFRGTGCAVCSAAAILKRFGRPFPTLSDGHTLDAVELGASMGGRHRAADRRVRHGLSLVPGQGCSGGYWCAYCIYLELKARQVPVAYGTLTEAQLVGHLKAGHPVAIPGDYWQVPVVSASSIAHGEPALGRVQRSLSTRPFGHMIVGWVLAGSTVIVSDPDFGSGGGDIPPHSQWSLDILLAFWHRFGSQPVCYAVTVPPAVGSPATPPSTSTTHYRYGGRPTSRGSYRIGLSTRVRTSPYVRADNIELTVSKAAGLTFAAAQATYAGTNVGGSTLWLGTAKGDRWVHSSLAKLLGHTTGREDIR